MSVVEKEILFSTQNYKELRIRRPFPCLPAPLLSLSFSIVEETKTNRNNIIWSHYTLSLCWSPNLSSRFLATVNFPHDILSFTLTFQDCTNMEKVFFYSTWKNIRLNNKNLRLNGQDFSVKDVQY